MTVDDFTEIVVGFITVKNIAQVISFFAMAAVCASYMQKRQNTVLILQLIGSILFSIQYFMLGAITGGILNIFSVLRAIVFLNRDRLKSNHPAWSIFFSVCYLISYPLAFIVVGKEPTLSNFFFEILPVIASVLALISFRYNDPKYVRRYGLACSPLWLTYNIANFSIGAIICEMLNLVSITIGILRYDVNKK